MFAKINRLIRNIWIFKKKNKITFHFLVETLKQQLAAVKAENKQMREEFNTQRAKLKELFLQKEGKYMCESQLVGAIN